MNKNSLRGNVNENGKTIFPVEARAKTKKFPRTVQREINCAIKNTQQNKKKHGKSIQTMLSAYFYLASRLQFQQNKNFNKNILLKLTVLEKNNEAEL